VHLETAFQGTANHLTMLGAGALCAARAVAVRRERAVWALFAAGLLLWGIGDLYYTLTFWGMEEAPFPSLADLGYFLFSPPVYAGLFMLLRARLPRVDRLLWIDGLTAALGAAALGASLLLGLLLATYEGPPATVATNLAYPLDLVLLSLVVGAFVVTGRGGIRAWGLIAAGLAVFALADVFFLVATARGGYVHGALFDAGWNVAGALMALAAWWPPGRLERVAAEGWRTIALPIAFALVAVALLVADHPLRADAVGVLLAAASLLAVLVRLVLTFADNLRMLRPVGSMRSPTR